MNSDDKTQLLELDDTRSGVLLIGRHERYLAHLEADGTIILTPAEDQSTGVPGEPLF